ncbi:retrovirus-related pol polyprotein from transposon TNT 1-94 [Tanacetum coccineum]
MRRRGGMATSFVKDIPKVAKPVTAISINIVTVNRHGRAQAQCRMGKSRHIIGALHSPRRELRNELKYVQSEVKINKISCLKVRHVENKIWELELSHIAQKGKMTNTQTPPPTTIVVNTTGAPVTNTVANHAKRPEKFNETVPQVEPPAEGQSSNAQAVQAVEAWKHLDFLCHNYVLNGLIDPLYNVYCKTTTAKELWESLERKYKIEDDGTKKFVVARFLDYKMVDPKNVISQVQDLQVLIYDIHAEGITLSETFQAAAIIEKLPLSWVDFKNYLKHKRKKMSVKDLVVRLRIKEDNRLALKDTYTPDSAKANLVEHVGSSLRSNPKGKGKDKRKNDKKSKRKSEYLAPKMPKRVNPCQANMVNDDVDMIAMVSDVCAMISENEINKMNSSTYLIRSSNVWHARLGHVNFNSMRRLIKFNSIPNCHIDSKYKCETCVEAKLTRTSFKSVKRTTEPLDMIHTDICDLKSLPTKGGNKYFITFIDDCTKYCYVYLLKSKDEAIDKFVLYKTEVENQLGKKIKVVRSDRGGEYVAPFAELCAKHGIRHEFTAPYSPQQNGIAERKNRTLKEMVTAMLISSGMSQDMWGEAILTATYLLNKIPRKEKEETPYELWMGRKPSYQYLRVWGCLAKVAVPTPKAQKIGPKSVDCIFIGYAKKSTAYRFIVHESKNPDIQKNTIMESRNASFFENIFPCLSKGTGSSSRLDDKVVQDKRQRDDNDLQDERQDQTEEEEVEPRRSKRARNEKSFGPDFVSFMVENEPTSYREAVTSSEGQQWR